MKPPWVSPWVSRVAYEQVAAERDAANARYADLVALYHALRLQGYALPVQPIAPPTVDRVLEAINRKSAGKGAQVRAAMIAQAAAERAASIDEDEIIARIHRGHRVADEFAS